MSLKWSYQSQVPEAGCDEAGRGCLAGPVYAAAVMLDPKRKIKGLADSKQLSEKARNALRIEIEENASAWKVAALSPAEIDTHNILKASFLAMHKCLEGLKLTPGLILVDGNRFIAYQQIPHQCIIKGDALYQSIAAASILAKTHRDEHMLKLHAEFPMYHWDQNKGYPTKAHRNAIREFGVSPHHRITFRLLEEQLQMSL